MKTLAAAALIVALVTPSQGEVIEQVLVKVNGDIITKTELEARQIEVLRDRGIDASTLKDDEALRKELLAVTPQLLVNAIDELLLVQMGREKGYRLQDEQFQGWLADFRKSNKLEDDARFEQALKQEGLTVAELRRQVERGFLVQQVQREEVGSKLTITEAEARQYYQAHRDEFVEPATVTLREIFIEVPTTVQGGQAGVNVSQDDQAKQEAEAAYKRVTGGEDFGKVAAELSDSASKANGGLIGPLPLADLSDALRKSLESMKPGDVLPPMPAGKGYQILKLEAMTPSRIQPFEAVRDIVADRVYEVRQRSEIRKFLARIRSQALIEWKNEDLRKMYEAQVAASANTL